MDEIELPDLGPRKPYVCYPKEKADAITKLCEAAEAAADDLDDYAGEVEAVWFGLHSQKAVDYTRELANALREAVKGVRGES